MMSQVALCLLKVESGNKTTHLPFGFNGPSVEVYFKKWFVIFKYRNPHLNKDKCLPSGTTNM
jgi:hypothetical protein